MSTPASAIFAALRLAPGQGSPDPEQAVDAASSGVSLREVLGGIVDADSWFFQKTAILENWQWIGLLGLIFLGVVLERITRMLFYRVALRLGRSESVSVDEQGLARFARPFGLLITGWLFVSFLPALDIEDTIERVLDIAVSFVVSIAGVWAAVRLVDVVSDFLRAKAQQTDNKFDDMLVPLLRKTLKIFVVVVGVVYLVSKLTNDIWKVLAGLSLGTLAVGLAARDSIENLFGTFTVLLDKPFQLGDWITVGDVDGTVEKVGIRSTRIRTFANSVITVPNRDFISATVNNWGARRYRRLRTILSLTYDTPPEKVEAFCEGLRELIRTHPHTRKDYYHVYLSELSESSLDVLLYCFFDVPDWAMELRERHRLLADTLRLAERLEVGFAFPTRTLHMVQSRQAEHPDRPASDPEGARRGREVALDVASASLAPYGGDKPGPVEFAHSPLTAPGEEDDGEGEEGV